MYWQMSPGIAQANWSPLYNHNTVERTLNPIKNKTTTTRKSTAHYTLYFTFDD